MAFRTTKAHYVESSQNVGSSAGCVLYSIVLYADSFCVVILKDGGQNGTTLMRLPATATPQQIKWEGLQIDGQLWVEPSGQCRVTLELSE